ncbi:CHAT domain-containing protein [Nocardia sp. NPDC051052]|uniref:CHAT domain-containing protein n=1 Tax=Nocardia sp. NPDC051052 TaxID=3364322 RepID=UPI0037ADE509
MRFWRRAPEPAPVDPDEDRQRSRTAEQWFEDGKKKFSDERYAQAAQAFERSTALAPDTPNGQYLLGASHFKLGDYHRALLPIAYCLSLAPDHVDAQHVFGVTLIRLGHHDRGYLHLARAAFLGHWQARQMLSDADTDFCRQCGTAVLASNHDEPVQCASCGGTGVVLRWRQAAQHTRTTDPARFGTRGALHELRSVIIDSTDHTAFDATISMYQVVLDGSAGHPDEHLLHADLGRTYLLRHRRTGVRTDLDEAITHLEHAAAAAAEGSTEQALTSSDLGIAYRERHRQTGAIADLDRAIQYHEQRLRGVALGSSDGVRNSSNLGMALLSRYLHGGAEADLSSAIGHLEQAVMGAEDDDVASISANLGSAYLARYERFGAAKDLDQCIALLERAVAATTPADVMYATRSTNLGNALRRRFQIGAATDDLDRATDCYQRAVAATPHRHHARPIRLANLAVVHRDRFGVSGLLADLDQAIDYHQQALTAMPDIHAERHGLLLSLGHARQSRFHASAAPGDLRAAIENYREARTLLPEDHPHRFGVTNDLGNAYLDLFNATGGSATQVLRQAIDLLENSVATGPDGHPALASVLCNLGSAYTMRFDHGGSIDDLRQAISILERAARDTGPGGPRTVVIGNLASSYRLAIDTGLSIGSDRLRALVDQLAVVNELPQDRVRAHRSVGVLADMLSEHEIAVNQFDAAVRLLPSVIPKAAPRADQEQRFRQHLGLNLDLTSEAVAAHCALDDPIGAVEAAEQSRGILLGSALDARTDLFGLDRDRPELAAELRRILDLVNSPDPPADTAPVDVIQRSRTRQRWWVDLEALLVEIRGYPGLERFLLPPELTELRCAAAGGAVVLVNSGRRRSDAIIVPADSDPILIPLPALTAADVRSYAIDLHDATTAGAHAGLTRSLRRQRVVSEILGWLWDTVVEPISAVLATQFEAGQQKPRVWWLPTGLLGLFPLHAAGHVGGACALDHCVSSYTPTLRALAHIRSRPPSNYRRQLTVALERTPGLPDLPGTVAEITQLLAGDAGASALIDQDATIGGVVTALHTVDWVHFACHAYADLTTPSLSGLLLQDGTLTVTDISRLRLDGAELAYLSACSTAHRGWDHVEESIHLASAFHLAGFRHVVASLWPLDDAVAAQAATDFYRHLPPPADATETADVLNRVTRELRERFPNRPDMWASLIHSGP